jgi:hypothetical protein
VGPRVSPVEWHDKANHISSSDNKFLHWNIKLDNAVDFKSHTDSRFTAIDWIGSKVSG